LSALSPRYSGPENVRIHAVVIAELELSDIARQVLAADLVEGNGTRGPFARTPRSGALTSLSSVMAGLDPATQPNALHAWSA